MKRKFGSWHNVMELSGPIPLNLRGQDLTPFGDNFTGMNDWSNFVLGKGDERLQSQDKSYDGFWGYLVKIFFWKKFIILKPVGDPDAEFIIGFYSEKHRICKVLNKKCLVSDGPFAMRLGPDDCKFFVVSRFPSNKHVGLENAGYIYNDMRLF